MKQNGMKFNKETKEEVRAELDKMLSRVRFNPKNRISNISKADLEMILFDQDPKTGLKVIGWHSKNLKKLDLSKVSFAGVYFGDDKEKDFSNTNIKIDLAECAWREYGCVDGSTNYDLVFKNMKLDGVDLSKTNFKGYTKDHYVMFDGCSLCNTGLHIKEISENDCLTTFHSCDLTNLDFSNRVLRKIPGYSTLSWGHLRFNGTNIYRNTNLIMQLTGNHTKEDLKYLLSDDKLAGCYFQTGERTVFLDTIQGKKAEAKNIGREYDKFIKDRKTYIKEIVEDAIKRRDNPDNEPIYYNDSNDIFRINKKSRDEIRQEIATLLSHVHYNSEHRVKLDNRLLDLLLFDYYVDKDGIKFKRLGFTAHSIDRLDLEEANFNDVSLDYTKRPSAFLSGTNAEINFATTYEFKKHRRVVAKNIDFAGIDLSKNDLTNHESEFYNCDLRNTGIRINQLQTDNIRGTAKFEACRLDELDLSKVSLEVNGKGYAIEIKDCDVTDTKIRFKTTYCSTPEEIKKIYTDGSYVGCFVNGKPIMGKYDIDKSKAETLAEYNKFAARKKKKILTNVQKAISKED